MPTNLSPLWISLRTASAATAITFVAGLAAAWWRVRGSSALRSAFDAVCMVPLVLPPTVVGYLLLVLFGMNSPVGRLLERMSVRIVFSWPATVMAATVVAFPLMYLAARGALEQVNRRYLQAARTLGAAEWRVFWQVMLPLARPGILAGTVLTFARALGEFGATLMIAGNLPGRTQTLPIAIFFAAEAGEMRQALVWVLITLGVSFTALAIFHQWPQQAARGAYPRE